VKIYSIKPSLQTTDGKLNRLCVEYMNCTQSCILFGLFDIDFLGDHGKLINKSDILHELVDDT
jgi:hypothetical protein